MNLKIKCRNNEFVNTVALLCACPKLILNLKNYILLILHQTLDSYCILIGLNYYFSFIKGNVIRSENDNLVALESKVGWILIGTHETSEHISNTHIYRVDCFPQKPEPVNSTLSKFLKTVSSDFLDTENDCVKTFKEKLIFNGSRYEVKLLFRPHTGFMPDNYVVVVTIHDIQRRKSPRVIHRDLIS